MMSDLLALGVVFDGDFLETALITSVIFVPKTTPAYPAKDLYFVSSTLSEIICLYISSNLLIISHRLFYNLFIKIF